MIVAEAAEITIYDGDDPSMPMWMVIDSSRKWFWDANRQSVVALNGVISVGVKSADSAYSGNGLYLLNFISDKGKASTKFFTPSVSPCVFDLSTGILDLDTLAYRPFTLVNYVINDVAMTVLPDAPIDPATGLPIPTIAVATDGGVSVIKDDGKVVDITNADYNNAQSVGFLSNNKIACHLYDFKRGVRVFTIPNEDISQTNHYSKGGAEEWYEGHLNVTGTQIGDLKLITSATSSLGFKSYIEEEQSDLRIANFAGLNTVSRNTQAPSEGMINHITSKYNTGWMNGDIKLATLSDTDDTDLVGSELVTNGTFDVDTSGWTAQLGAILTNVNNQLSVESVGNNSLAYQIFPADLNKQYILNITVVEGTCRVVTGGWSAGTLAVGTHAVVIKAGRSNNKLDIIPPTGGIAVVDNVSVTLAEQDRSVNGNGLQVFGTVTREPVATGADLVGYGGFSNSNYLVQPYNPDLDFGTGDFCVMGWVNNTSSFSKHFFTISNSQGTNWGTNGYITVKYNADFSRVECLFAGGGILTDSQLTDGAWHHLCLLRKNGVVYAYLDGKIVASQSNTNNLGATTIDSKFYMGVSVYNGNIASNPSTKQALWRVSKTAPTAEQVAKIYRDEKVLFQEGAQATLHGTSDAVTALAYDTDTHYFT